MEPGPPGVPPRKKVYLRPSNNPLLRAPKNSTQFIIDDHENSQHFMSFQRGEDQEGLELSEEELTSRLSSVEEREVEKKVGSKEAGDFWIDPFRNAYSEKDFDTVYEKPTRSRNGPSTGYNGFRIVIVMVYQICWLKFILEAENPEVEF